MAAKKYITLTGIGRRQLTAATVTSAGGANDGDIVALDPTGRLDSTLLPVGVTPEAKIVLASEVLIVGPVNLYNNAGTANVRKADATTPGKEANGYVLQAVAAAANATVFFEGIITGLTGLTPGARYYLATTAGTITATAPAGSGNVVQYLGPAISATELNWEPDDGVLI